jgi:hypothetical protein
MIIGTQKRFVLIRGGAPASSTTKTGRHDIAEILLKVALNTKNQTNQSISLIQIIRHYYFIFILEIKSLHHFVLVCFEDLYAISN